jgi:hypothetical protein
MKTLTSKIQILITLILLLAVTSCSKQSVKCETWQIEDDGTLKEGCILDFSCGSKTLNLTFCGDELKNAKAGNTIILSEDDCCKKTRTFVKLVK